MTPGLEEYDLILTNGPPFTGKERFCTNNFSKSHQIIYPRQLYRENSKFGIRDVALVAYTKLKEGHKVVILDTNENGKTRESYVRLLKKKFESLRVAIVSIVPRYGCQQLFWSREFKMAEESLQGDTGHRHCDDDERILRWFDRSSDTAVVYKQGTVDAVKDSEADTIHQDEQGLVATSVYKFEVQALFIQWECLSSLQNENEWEKFVSDLVEVLNCWSLSAPWGRIIIVCDGSQIRTGEKSRSQQISDIEESLGKITTRFSASPVYVYHVEKPTVAGSYVLPPNPGILAYLQRRHCLNLISKHTVYMYESTAHMKMAENAGVRHVKASRIISQPKLVASGHIATIPSIPEMLKQLTVQMSPDSQKPAMVPLYERAKHFKEGRVHTHLGYGRSEFLCADNWETVERYQELYSEKAKRVSDLSPVKTANEHKSRTSLGTISSTACSETSLGSRDLPKWMMSREESSASNASNRSSLSSSSSLTEKKVRQSVYVMSEKELVEMATEILKQAGKTDMIQTVIKEEQRTTETKPATPVIKTHGQNRTRKPAKRKNAKTDISETLGSLCPKMEVDDFDEVEYQDKERDVSPRKKTKTSRDVIEDTVCSTDSKSGRTKRNIILDKDNKCKEELDIEEDIDIVEPMVTRNSHVRGNSRSDHTREVVGSLLDDFIDVTAQRKPSPKKKTQDVSSALKTRSRETFESPKRGQEKVVDSKSKAATVNKKTPRHTPDLSILDDIFL